MNRKEKKRGRWKHCLLCTVGIAAAVALAISALETLSVRMHLLDHETFGGSHLIQYKTLRLSADKGMGQNLSAERLRLLPVPGQLYPALEVREDSVETVVPGLTACEAGPEDCQVFLQEQLDMPVLPEGIRIRRVSIDGHPAWQITYGYEDAGTDGLLSSQLKGKVWFIPTETGMYQLDFRTYRQDGNDYRVEAMTAAIPLDEILKDEVDAILGSLQAEYSQIQKPDYLPEKLAEAYETSNENFWQAVRTRSHMQARAHLDQLRKTEKSWQDWEAQLSFQVQEFALAENLSKKEEKELASLRSEAIKCLEENDWEAADAAWQRMRSINEEEVPETEEQEGSGLAAGTTAAKVQLH